MNRLLSAILTAVILFAVTLAIILYGRGYRIDIGKRLVKATGSLVATSYPDGASVTIDEKLVSATNTTIPLAPGWYNVKIVKEGYIPWQKKLRIDAEVVSKTDSLLFPINPSLSPLTSLAIEQFVVSPDGSKLAFVNRPGPSSAVSGVVNPSPQSTATPSAVESLPRREGIFVLDMNETPLAINRFPRQILDFSILPTSPQPTTDNPSITSRVEGLRASRQPFDTVYPEPFDSAQGKLRRGTQGRPTTLLWSPDSKQLLLIRWKMDTAKSSKTPPRATKATTPQEPLDLVEEAYLLDSNRNNSSINNISAQLPAILDDWQDKHQTKLSEQLLGFPREIQRLATSSARVVAIAPDETKVLYQAIKADSLSKVLANDLIGSNTTAEEREIHPDNFYIYDLKEDKNYRILDWQPPSTASLSHAKAFVAKYSHLIPDLYYPLRWYPDSRHLIYFDGDRIVIMEYDGENRVPVYAGPLVNGFVAPWPSGGRLVILTSLNSTFSGPSLYSVNIK